MSKKTNDWIVTTERYVVFVDIMGFKDMVLRSSHDEIYSMMKRMDKKKKFSESIKWVDGDTEYVRTTTYSDSIMIYSKDKSYQSQYSIVCTISSLMIDMFAEGIPFKGAMAFGNMTLDTDNSIFFGQPLIDAYTLQEELNFYGIIVHASAEKEISEQKNQSPFLTNYLCPLKSGTSSHLTICPMIIDPSMTSNDEIKKESEDLLLNVKNLRFKTSGHLRKYIDNTEVYLKKVGRME